MGSSLLGLNKVMSKCRQFSQALVTIFLTFLENFLEMAVNSYLLLMQSLSLSKRFLLPELQENNLIRIIESMMELRLRQRNLRLVFKFISVMRGLHKT